MIDFRARLYRFKTITTHFSWGAKLTNTLIGFSYAPPPESFRRACDIVDGWVPFPKEGNYGGSRVDAYSIFVIEQDKAIVFFKTSAFLRY